MRAKLKILVIDDEEAITKTIKRALTIDGYENILIAHSYKEAIDIIKNNQPQVIISDINLPDGTGLDLLKESKHISPLSQVIMLTGKSDEEKVITAVECGATDFLRKPMNMAEFKDIVKLSVDRVYRWANLFEDLIIEHYNK